MRVGMLFLVAYVASGRSIRLYRSVERAVLTTMTDAANRPKLFVELPTCSVMVRAAMAHHVGRFAAGSLPDVARPGQVQVAYQRRPTNASSRRTNSRLRARAGTRSRCRAPRALRCRARPYLR